VNATADVSNLPQARRLFAIPYEPFAYFGVWVR
jgi:hypothetical protein